MTATAQTAKPATRRSLKVLSPFAGTNRATIRITTQKGNARPDSTDYDVEFLEVDPSLGRCQVEFRKVFTEVKERGMTSQVYNVLVSDEGQGVQCDCTGSQYYGSCRHRECVPTLLKLRKGN